MSNEEQIRGFHPRCLQPSPAVPINSQHAHIVSSAPASPASAATQSWGAGQDGALAAPISPPPTPCTQQLFAAKLLCPCRAHGSACMAPLQREVLCSATGCSALQCSVMERCFHLSSRTTPSGLLKGCVGQVGFASHRGSQDLPPPVSMFVQFFC